MSRVYSIWLSVVRAVDAEWETFLDYSVAKITAFSGTITKTSRNALSRIVVGDNEEPSVAPVSTCHRSRSFEYPLQSAISAPIVGRNRSTRTNQQALCNLSMRLDRLGLRHLHLPGQYLTIAPPIENNVLIMIECADSRFTFQLEGIFEVTHSEQDVVDWVTIVHRQRSRLRVDSIQGRPFRWTLEYCDPFGEWLVGLSTGHVGVCSVQRVVHSQFWNFSRP